VFFPFIPDPESRSQRLPLDGTKILLKGRRHIHARDEIAIVSYDFSRGAFCDGISGFYSGPEWLPLSGAVKQYLNEIIVWRS